MIVQGANPYFCHNDVGYCEAEAMVVGEGGLGRIEAPPPTPPPLCPDPAPPRRTTSSTTTGGVGS
jgi:hypothetical protein